MSQAVALAVHVREGKGTRIARKLRDTGMIPGIVYGHKETPVQVTVTAKEFNHAVRVLKARTIEIVLGGKKETVLIKDLQFDYLSKHIVHFDLLRVSASDTVKVKVKVELRGAPKTTGGGVLEQPLHELHIECGATAIPESVRVDISALQLGHPIHVSDLKLPPGVTVLEADDAVVVQLKLPGQEPEVAEAETAEPEVLTAKKPKDGDAE